MFTGAGREHKLSTKSTPGGQKDRGLNLAGRGGGQCSRQPLTGGLVACLGRENGLWPEHRDEKERSLITVSPGPGRLGVVVSMLEPVEAV